MVEKKNRCVRLNYANEFHMDILPAAPNIVKNGGCVKVPDRKVEEWKDSNPSGYAKWFEFRSEELLKAFEARYAASVQPLPAHEPMERKTPLQRSVQLMKRYRDIYYKQNPDSAPISIVLTTLAGMHYTGQYSVAEALKEILQGISGAIPGTGKRLLVLNPTNTDEDLSEKWDEKPALYFEFVRWTKEFVRLWNEFQATNGIHNVRKALVAMFGEDVTEYAINEQAEFLEKARKERLLGITQNTGVITSTSSIGAITIRKNTFYGS
jgi:hypothetical protein